MPLFASSKYYLKLKALERVKIGGTSRTAKTRRRTMSSAATVSTEQSRSPPPTLAIAIMNTPKWRRDNDDTSESGTVPSSDLPPTALDANTAPHSDASDNAESEQDFPPRKRVWRSANPGPTSASPKTIPFFSMHGWWIRYSRELDGDVAPPRSNVRGNAKGIGKAQALPRKQAAAALVVKPPSRSARARVVKEQVESEESVLNPSDTTTPPPPKTSLRPQQALSWHGRFIAGRARKIQSAEEATPSGDGKGEEESQQKQSTIYSRISHGLEHDGCSQPTCPSPPARPHWRCTPFCPSPSARQVRCQSADGNGEEEGQEVEQVMQVPVSILCTWLSMVLDVNGYGDEGRDHNANTDTNTNNKAKADMDKNAMDVEHKSVLDKVEKKMVMSFSVPASTLPGWEALEEYPIPEAIEHEQDPNLSMQMGLWVQNSAPACVERLSWGCIWGRWDVYWGKEKVLVCEALGGRGVWDAVFEGVVDKMDRELGHCWGGILLWGQKCAETNILQG
ncbi:hypothetical protein FA15DRAFT_658817 [Coprinopsis marcescibilis]|uniref:Uncharacterized protein n=1 Tax=Coprinopsis marcescibilis TaxID=230819 RepID=A0A5C3KKS4_COPMA|nr:hypothetical protein FA15DRAFT_658817 [Coprinopsis marcescibilis]